MENPSEHVKSDMWQTLITILNNITEDNQIYIFETIRKNLTFDDSGLFSLENVNQEELKRSECCNTWLFNQLISCLINKKLYKSIQQNIDLQKDIISSSFIKQPWYFNLMVLKIMELTNILQNIEIPIKEVTNISVFNVTPTDYDICKQYKTCCYKSIEINSETVKNNLLKHCIELLTHSSTFFVGFDENLNQKCNDLILNIFKKSNLKIKLQCIRYFNNLFKNILTVNTLPKEHMFYLFIGILTIINKLLTSKQIDTELPQYIIETKRFLQKVQSLKVFTKPAITNIFLSCVLTLKRITLLNDSKIMNDLGNAIINFTKEYYKDIQSDEYELNILKQLITDLCQFPNLIILLENQILEELKGKNNTIIVSDCSISITWQQIYKYLCNIMIKLEQGDYTWDKLNSYLMFVQITMKSVISIEHNYNLWSQQTNGKNSEYSHLIFFQPSEIDIGKSLINIVKQIINYCDDKYELLLNIISNFCRIYDFTLIDTKTQIQLVQIVFCPFMKIVTLNINENEFLSKILKQIENQFVDSEQISEFYNKCIESMLSIKLDYMSDDCKSKTISWIYEILSYIMSSNLYKNNVKEEIILQSINIIINKFTTQQNNLLSNILLPAHQIQQFHFALSKILKNLICLLSENVEIIKILEENKFPEKKNTQQEYNFQYKIICHDCDKINNSTTTEMETTDNNDTIKELKGLTVKCHVIDEIKIVLQSIIDFKLIESTNKELRINMIKSLPSLFNHSTYNCNLKWTNLFIDEDLAVRICLSNTIGSILNAFMKKNNVSEETKNVVIRECLENLLQSVKLSLNTLNHPLQSCVVNMILKVASSKTIKRDNLLLCFKMIICFIIQTKSMVKCEAIMCATDICTINNVTPLNLFYWYKQNIVQFIISLVVSVFLRNETPLTSSLKNVTQMLGFSNVKKFIKEYYKLIIAMLLPYCIKYPKCQFLLLEVSHTIGKELSEALSFSFLTIYPYLFINEKTEINNKCIDYIIQHTDSTLYHLLHSDIKKTVAEILIYYHKSPECVMKVFRSIFSEDQNIETDITVSKMTDCIATRFLGILIFFGDTLIHPINDKTIKRETLLSLGEIIRFLGPTHITGFRFKILAMLKTALAIDDSDLSEVCAKVWTIFIHTVDIDALGPLLSTIIVSLEPLLKFQYEEVSKIFKYLIVTNGNLLSVHIPDLFFIDDINVSTEIKTIVRKQTEGTQSEHFIEKLSTFIKHINHENLEVRVFGLKYLRILLAKNRNELNHLIVGQNTMNPIVERILENLTLGCRHVDEKLQLAAGKCLGELGAIEPSLITPNYAPQFKFALGIHTDLFAIMALDELCRAYQFQKDTKYVDSYSLAIQEILLEREVCPKKNKKINVWEAIPMNLRPLMEPLLTSCYAGFRKSLDIQIHPIFGSRKYISCHEWAFAWACKLIGNVRDELTQNLLNSFRPSIKRNMNILSIFLPYIILHSLISGEKKNQQNIVEEMTCVFQAVTKTEQQNKNKKNYSIGLKLRTLDYIPNEHMEKEIPLNDDEEGGIDFGIKCAKIAFNQLDFFSQWLRQSVEVHKSSTVTGNHQIVEQFLKKFDKKLVAEANFSCKEYARALLYIESYIEEKPGERLQSELSFLAKIYAELMNSDSLEGAMSLKTTEPTLSEQILAHNVTGRLQESAACFERLLQVSEISVENMKDVVQCYLGLDQPETALLMSEGLLRKVYNKYNILMLQETRAESLWRMSRFDELEKLTQIDVIQNSSNWSVKCGQMLLNIKKNEPIEFENTIKTTRLTILKLLRTTGIEQNAYLKGYPLVMKLHFINEFENIAKILKNPYNLFSIQGKVILKKLLNEWDSRLEFIQPTARLMEPILCLRRIMLIETKSIIENNCVNKQTSLLLTNVINKYICKLWIKSSELAREAGMIQKTQLYIMNAESYENKGLFLESAKLFWKKGEQSNSLKTLERGIKDIIDLNDKNPNNWKKSLQNIYSEAKLLIATYNAESMNCATETIIKYFKEAVIGFNETEKGLVYYAQYLDRIYASLSDDDQQKEKGTNILLDIMVHYGKSMRYGCHYIYQSMPRMLSIWLDYAAKTRNNELNKKVAKQLNIYASQFCEILPSFMFFTAFSQLVSRICHPSNDVYCVLKTILVKLIIHFPQQSLWKISSVFKSSYSNRVKRCSEIFQDKRLSHVSTQKLITDFNSLAEKLIELTNKDISTSEQNETFSVSSLVKNLPKLFNTKFSPLILPIQQHLQPILPATCKRDKTAESFNAFPHNLIYINGIKDELTILPSLQRPRKIILIGTDGKEYVFMLKPKDDLRKDFRLMEFNAVVKEYLHQDSDARERRLNIRTYAVSPLNEECGIIEWVQNLQAFRHIVTSIYKQRNCTMSVRDLKNAACTILEPLSKKRQVFLDTLVPRHPAVFSEWFKNRFTTPHNWYQARSSYIKTTAVMSMVGYILGLGDRHGENILYDTTNGDTVHVDFNCLFNKGETFDYPERVPFRLTHNMTHAMGPLGVEGQYRKCCEITLKILRAQTPTLMSVLKPFVYDPLVSWSRTSNSTTNIERTDQQAMTNVKHIEERLKGYVKINGKTSNMLLSAEGQVNSIIAEAMNVDNLAAMYIGWGAYM